MLHIRVGHGRVFAHDVHAANLTRMHGVHDLDDGEPWYRIERRSPQCFELGAHVGIVDALVIRKDHRDEPRVGSALDIVLSPQRVQARARATDLAGDQR